MALSLEQLAQEQTMRFFLLRSQANRYGNASRRQREWFDNGIALLLPLIGQNEEAFETLCWYFRIFMQRLQEVNPQVVIPQLTPWNEFDRNTLP
ncbi:unnamed protein product [Caenorhabditis angaria]|uniref:Uncharacterized protein n=1 Tax=Caenorhabditis angaria TaxID=860376 RepID=A0A9P1N9V0_9PELO|nr:unnamed protein product [Caenorhabditis angaria]